VCRAWRGSSWAKVIGANHTHHAWCIAAHCQHAIQQVFLADETFVDVLDAHAVGRVDRLDAIPQEIGKLRIIKYADTTRVQKTLHPACVTRPGSVSVTMIPS
jgi:hypothetical protein